MIDFICINPSSHRENCFNIESVSCSRWQVDFYQLNEDYDPIDPDDEKHFIGSLHFTAYNLKQETSKEAYKALQLQLNYLLKASEQSQVIRYTPFKLSSLLELTQYNQDDPFTSFTYLYEDINTSQLKSTIKFYELITGKKQVFTINNIENINDMSYLYYSSLKWLYYPFGADTNTKCLDDVNEFIDLINGDVKLKDYLQNSCY